MKHKQTLIVTIIIAVVLVAVGVLAILKQTPLWNTNTASEAMMVDPHSEILTESTPGNPLNSDTWNEKTVSVTGITYSVIAAEQSKERGELPIPVSYPPKIQFDDNGTIINSYTYVRVQFSIENNQQQELELSLGSNQLEVYDENNLLNKFEFISMLSNTDLEVKGVHEHYRLKENEKKVFTLAYAVDDEYINSGKRFVFKVTNGGDYVTFNGGDNTEKTSDRVRRISLNDFIE